MRRKLTAAVLICVMVSIVPTSFAAVIKDIAGNLLQSDLYHGSGDYFQMNFPGSDWPTYTDVVYFSTDDSYYWLDSSMSMNTFDFGASALVADLSTYGPGGLAKGRFASGATLTINGNLYDDSYENIVASGDLVTAVVTTQWTLEELPAPARANTLSGRAFFHITGGALSNPSLNTDGLVMGDFYLDFLFQATSPNVSDFSTLLGNDTYDCLHPTIQGATMIPEPASLIIMGIGSMAMIRRKKLRNS